MKCHGLGRVYEVTELSMVPDPSLTIRERARLLDMGGSANPETMAIARLVVG